MKISSIIKDSFQEFKDRHSLILFLQGCNFKCNGCYNYDEICKNKTIGNVYDILDKNITPMHDAVVVLGGEPTIWRKEFIDLLAFIKNSKSLETKVFSNGFLPEVIIEANEKHLVGAWSFDIKCIIDCSSVLGINISDNEYLRRLKISIKNSIDNKIPIEIRTTKWPCVLSQINKISEYVKTNFPEITHIIQDDFNSNF